MTSPAVFTPNRTTAATDNRGQPFVPLRKQPDEPDRNDGQRVNMVRSGWERENDLWRPQMRTIEEIVRMISGQQRAIFHPILGRWLDVNEWMPADERSYRARPVFNRMLMWFVLTHARATENTPIVTFVPGPDRLDAELSEVMDTVSKTVWFEANMEDVHDRLMAWVVAAGRGHLFSRIDPSKGQMRPWVGEGMLPVVDMYHQPVMDDSGEQMSMHLPHGVPFDKNGNPVASWRLTGPGTGEMVQHATPHATPTGQVVVDVLSPFQVRGSWGSAIPWHEKRVHRIRRYLTPEEVFDTFGVQVEPTVRGSASDVGELERIMYGAGFYGSAGGDTVRQMAQVSTDGFVELFEEWHAPCSYPGMSRDEDPNGAGGRWTVVTPKQVIRDGVRPANFPYTSPLNTFEFIRVPGRPGGTTAAETLVPIQREINEDRGRVKDHINLRANPIGVVDSASGLKGTSFSNKPGVNYELHRRPNVPAIEFVRPPELGSEVFANLRDMAQEFETLGFTAGANDPAAPGDSGEKVKEVRFNTDRFLGPTMRRAAGEYGRMYETWMVYFPMIWDMETTIRYAGEDNIARTITVYPELFKNGKVNTRPDVESMLPEGRGEKQEKVVWAYMNGLLDGPPGSPQAIAKFWDLAQMPHLSRMAKPGGIHGTTAEQENGQLLLGTDPTTIPVYEWYNDDVHLMIHEKFMSSPEFKKLDPQIQDAFAIHRKAHLFNRQQKQMQAIGQANALQASLGGPAGPGAPPGGAPAGGPPPDNSPPPPPNAGDIRPPLPTPPHGPFRAASCRRSPGPSLLVRPV